MSIIRSSHQGIEATVMTGSEGGSPRREQAAVKEEHRELGDSERTMVEDLRGLVGLSFPRSIAFGEKDHG